VVRPRLLLYFDTNNRLQAGTWGVEVSTANIAYFKFASVVGFTMTGLSDDWGSGDIKFNPTTTANSTWEADAAGYSAIPGWNSTNTTVTKPSTYGITSNPDYVSTTVHTLANVKAGYGDPCQLVGYTGSEINAMSSLPASAYRLPTNPENNAFVGYSGTAAADANIGTTYGILTSGSPGYMTFPNSDPANQILPAVGGRVATGSASSWGAVGRYWSATPVSDTQGYYLYFSSSYVGPSYTNAAEFGMAVRCVPNN
jgi:uncharacterized protein (TIGR02145 family)